jgi:hypothetical protein
MAVSITNKTDERVLLRFNSGTTRYLGPREVLEGVEHVEVKGNVRIHSLGERRIIAIRSDAEQAGTGARRGRAAAGEGDAGEDGEDGESRPARALKKLRRPRKQG